MPIGNSYPRDVVIEDPDLFLGTKASVNNTVNYTANGIANYLNINGKVSITGQLSFKFVEINGFTKTISFDGGGGNNTLFSDITQLIVSKVDLSGQQVEIFLEYLIDKEILLAAQNEINSFGNYKITGYAVTTDPNFYTLDLEFIGGNGVIIKDTYYDLVAFSGAIAEPYILPIASNTILGGVKIGDGINIAIDGMISVSIPMVGTWGTLNYPRWVSGTPFVKMTGDGLFTLDGTIYVPQSRTITINGDTQNLSANGSWTIATSTSPLTTKGDLYIFSTTDARLPIGLDTQVLIADSTQVTGMKWGSNTATTPTGYYGAWQDDVTQVALSNNTGYPMIFRKLDLSNGISVVTNGTNLTRITFANTGIYNLQFSSQFQNLANSPQDVTIWLRLNGVDVPGTAGIVGLEARKNPGDPYHIIIGWNYLLDVVAGQYYELMWSTTDHTNVQMQYYAAGSPPPSAASVIMTVTQQSGIMAGTGITAINSLTGAAQTLTTGTSGTDFNIVDSGTDHKFNLPVASAVNTGKLSNTDWTTFNNKQNALGFIPSRAWKSGIDGTTVANTLTITPTYSQIINGNTFTAGDVVYLSSRIYSAGAKTSISSIYIYVNTTNNLSGTPIQVAIYSGLSTTRTIQIERTLAIKGATTRVLTSTSSGATDTTTSGASSLLSIDWTVNQYIIFAIGHTVADQTMTGDMYKIQKM